MTEPTAQLRPRRLGHHDRRDDRGPLRRQRPAGPTRGLRPVDQGIRWTWAELNARSFAAGLLALGLQPGDRIGIWSPNNAAWIITQFATAKAGLILVNINPAYRLTELEYALNKVECRALVTATGSRPATISACCANWRRRSIPVPPGSLQAERLPHLRILIHISDTDEPGFLPFDAVQRLGARRGIPAWMSWPRRCNRTIP